MVSRESLKDLQQRASELAALVPDLDIKIESEGVPEVAARGLILIFTYTVTYRGETTKMNCSSDQLGQQMSSFIHQLKPELTPEQIDRLHKVQTWQP